MNSYLNLPFLYKGKCASIIQTWCKLKNSAFPYLVGRGGVFSVEFYLVFTNNHSSIEDDLLRSEPF